VIMSRRPDPTSVIRTRSGLARWKNTVYANLIILSLACLAAWSVREAILAAKLTQMLAADVQTAHGGGDPGGAGAGLRRPR